MINKARLLALDWRNKQLLRTTIQVELRKHVGSSVCSGQTEHLLRHNEYVVGDTIVDTNVLQEILQIIA